MIQQPWKLTAQDRAVIKKVKTRERVGRVLLWGTLGQRQQASVLKLEKMGIACVKRDGSVGLLV